VERLFSGNQHLGVSDDTAIRRIIDLVLNGLWKKDQGGQLSPAESKPTKSKPAGTRPRLGNRKKQTSVASKSTATKKISRKPSNSTKEK
jgi:hypothetical protein